MAATMKDLGIDSLDVNDRLALVHEIWDSIPEQSEESDVHPTQRIEIDRRVAELDANPENVLTWKEIESFVRRKR